MNVYGHFNEQNNFVITNPFIPEAWLHYLIRPNQGGTETFCSGVSHAGGGFDVRGTHENTIVDTRLHLNDADEMGRYVYIKDTETGELFTTTWQPVRPEDQKFTTIFAFGEIRFDSCYADIETAVQMVVTEKFDGWLQNITIKNNSERTRHLEVYPFVPIHMGDALVRLLAGDNDAFFGGAAFDKDLKGIVFRRNHGIPVSDESEKINGMLGNVVLFYSTLNTEETHYETNLERFFGDRFHNQKNPMSIEKSRLSSENTAHLRRACGVFKHSVVLEPGEKIEFAVSLIAGSTADYYLNRKKQLSSLCALIDSPDERKKMAYEVCLWWKARMELLKISAPVPEIDRAFPWLQYQCEIVLVLNRMKSRFHTGYEYGWGFRDILQDILYLLPYRPLEMKKTLAFISTQIFRTGQVYHNFFITQNGNKSIEASDDPLWFVQAVIRLCKETGDFIFLHEITDYADAREEQIVSRGSILEHCFSCISRVLEDCSPRGLPYMKDCDWNDDLNEKRINGEPSRSMESVMVAQQLYAVLNDFSELLDMISANQNEAISYRKTATAIKESLEAFAFDSEGYFKRALTSTIDGKDSEGSDLGSSLNAEGKIFLETQVFGINSGLVDKPKAAEILSSVEKYLDTEWGAMLCYPFYTGLAERGALPDKTWNIEKEPPGMKENGGIFMHLNGWLIESYCRTGMGKKAVDLYLKTLPQNMSRDQDVYKAEPYVYPEYVRGKGQAEHGRGGHTWLTGTAPTIHTALTEYIFGVRAEYKGLRIDPCVDPSWGRFSMTRSFRNAVYQIDFENPFHIGHGVLEIRVDGQSIQGNLVPAFSDEKIHRVTVKLHNK